MKEKGYLLKKEGNVFYYSPAIFLQNFENLKLIDHPIRVKILRMLSKEELYPAEIARRLKVHEQKIYYHMKQLINADILEIKEKIEIRGTVAKKYAAKGLNFAVSLDDNWKQISDLVGTGMDKELEAFLSPFVAGNQLNATIVVGSPDPHGPFKARARDSHYAIDVGMFLGNHATLSKNFGVKLDVDVKIKNENDNLVVVGGPVTNLIVPQVNEELPVKFSEKKPWGLISEKTGKRYTEDSIGVIAKIVNPHFSDKSILVLAGVGYNGTKSSVIALTRHYKELLSTYTGQKRWASVVQGFDLDSDGRIDSVEILE